MKKRTLILIAVHTAILVMLFFADEPIMKNYISMFKWSRAGGTEKIEMVKGGDDFSVTNMSVTITVSSNATVLSEQTVTVPAKNRVEVYKVKKRKSSSLQKRARWFTGHTFWDFFEQFGLFYGGVLIALFLWEYDPAKRKYLIVLLLSIILTGIIVWFFKHTTGKIRPGLTGGELTFLEFLEGWGRSSNICFPSGHTTGAFVLGAFLACMYPRISWLFYTAAALCGISRMVTLAHWPADVYAGALLGTYFTKFTYTSFLRVEPLLTGYTPGWFSRLLFMDEPLGLRAGMPAPQFDGSVRLADYSGSWVVLSFLTKAFCPASIEQARALERVQQATAGDDSTVVIGVCCDHADILQSFSRKYLLSFPLVCDAHKKILKLYHARSLNIRRARSQTFIIDPAGCVAYVFSTIDTRNHDLEIYGALCALRNENTNPDSSDNADDTGVS